MDQAAGAKQSPAKISGDNNTGLVDVLFAQNIKDRQSGGPLRLPVIGKPLQNIVAAKYPSVDMMRGIRILLSDAVDECVCFGLIGQRPAGGYKPGFFSSSSIWAGPATVR